MTQMNDTINYGALKRQSVSSFEFGMYIYSVNGNFNYLQTTIPLDLIQRKTWWHVLLSSPFRIIFSTLLKHYIHSACFSFHSPSLIIIRLHLANGFDYTVTRPAQWRVYKQNVTKKNFFVWTNVALKCRKQFCVARNTICVQNIRSSGHTHFSGISILFWVVVVMAELFWLCFSENNFLNILFSRYQRKWIWIKMESLHSMNL